MKTKKGRRKAAPMIKRKGNIKMKKHIEYITVDKWGTVHVAFNTKEEAERALSWFPAEMEPHVEERTVWGG